jgi:hypothetical protein
MVRNKLAGCWFPATLLWLFIGQLQIPTSVPLSKLLDFREFAEHTPTIFYDLCLGLDQYLLPVYCFHRLVLPGWGQKLRNDDMPSSQPPVSRGILFGHTFIYKTVNTRGHGPNIYKDPKP